MAYEELMTGLPENYKRVEIDGPFCIRNNGGSFTVMATHLDLVTCGGTVDGKSDKERAQELASALNKIFYSKSEIIAKLIEEETSVDNS